jgi:WD40 repeat protein
VVNDLHEYDSVTEEQTESDVGPVRWFGSLSTILELNVSLLQSNVLSVATSPDGRWVISGMDSSIRIWDAHNATTQCTLETAATVEAVDVSPASCYFACGNDDGTVSIWRYSSHTPSGCIETD